MTVVPALHIPVELVKLYTRERKNSSFVRDMRPCRTVREEVDEREWPASTRGGYAHIAQCSAGGGGEEKGPSLNLLPLRRRKEVLDVLV